MTFCLTTEHVGDPAALPDLLADVIAPVRRFIADGTCDGTQPPRRSGRPRDRMSNFPPPKTAVPTDCELRNARIDMIAGHGHGSRGEARIGRFKQVIGPNLRGRKLETQTTETKIATRALNRMNHLGRVVHERVA
ncbi:hypothetical protein [Paracoccus sp. (in: a-proteobacteria)]|uniref:hypothetical protein n=1 Tax=Paracoccus sp. TaxID=267 RepID=UPI003A8AB925